MPEYDESEAYGTYETDGEISPYQLINQMKSWNKEVRLTVSDGFKQVVSYINLSPEEVKISAERVELSGYATFTALATDGETSIHGGNILTDTITANSLLVAELSAITSNLGTINAGVINGVVMNGVEINGGEINVDTDVTIGEQLIMGVGGVNQSINFGYTGANIMHYIDGGMRFTGNLNRFDGDVQIYQDLTIYGYASFTREVYFDDTVDFSSAQVVGLTTTAVLG